MTTQQEKLVIQLGKKPIYEKIALFYETLLNMHPISTISIKKGLLDACLILIFSSQGRC